MRKCSGTSKNISGHFSIFTFVHEGAVAGRTRQVAGTFAPADAFRFFVVARILVREDFAAVRQFRLVARKPESAAPAQIHLIRRRNHETAVRSGVGGGEGCWKKAVRFGANFELREVYLRQKNQLGSAKVKISRLSWAWQMINFAELSCTRSKFYWADLTKLGTLKMLSWAWTCLKNPELSSLS